MNCEYRGPPCEEQFREKVSKSLRLKNDINIESMNTQELMPILLKVVVIALKARPSHLFFYSSIQTTKDKFCL